MSRLINVSDGVYEELTLLKRARNASYSEAISGLLKAGRQTEKKHTWDEVLARLKARAKSYKGKRETTDHDKILYGGEYARL